MMKSIFKHFKNVRICYLFNAPDFNKTVCLTTNASNTALGSILSQDNKKIAYYFRTLKSVGRNYVTIKPELLNNVVVGS